MSKRFDLGDIDTVKAANKGFDVELYHPSTEEDTGIFITVLGKDSDEFQKISRQQNKKRIDRMTKNGFRPNKATPSQEELDANGLELLAACTIGWKTIDGDEEKDTILFNGEELNFSVGAAKKLYTERPWVKEQVDIAIGDRANFIKA